MEFFLMMAQCGVTFEMKLFISVDYQNSMALEGSKKRKRLLNCFTSYYLREILEDISGYENFSTFFIFFLNRF
ncbi:hypothetical protein BpHYR1_018307 [Brachionus plicatilis]|uniref:Uncharacterized protein n=1 Tax=Brachionus plicatilis TaxID=10195 RepID=A0A3M7RD48_BRAPC|nr:hypothetical protein BpHYR1_018307 [Brachionus plicatilis]